MSLDEAVKEQVLRILGQGALRMVRFSSRLGKVDASLFADVKSAVGDGRIAVRHDGSLPWLGCYQAGSNVLSFQTVPLSHMGQACVVHECVHAGFDLRGYSWMLVPISETLAFVAEALYAKAAFAGVLTSGSADPNTRTAENAVFAVAHEVADMLFRGETPADADWDAVCKAVLVTPTYRMNLSLCGYNGVPEARR